MMWVITFMPKRVPICGEDLVVWYLNDKKVFSVKCLKNNFNLNLDMEGRYVLD